MDWKIHKIVYFHFLLGYIIPCSYLCFGTFGGHVFYIAMFSNLKLHSLKITPVSYEGILFKILKKIQIKIKSLGPKPTSDIYPHHWFGVYSFRPFTLHVFTNI